MMPDSLALIRDLNGKLSARVLGQTAALMIIAALFRHWLAGLTENAPRFLLLGPTGVGKTECCLALAGWLPDHPLRRMDMSEHQLQESVGVLLGDRGGDPGLLWQMLGDDSPKIALFDEIEKAHPRVLDLWLQMLEPGHVTTAAGQRLDLTRVPMFCTSNLSTASLTEMQNLSAQSIEDHVLEQVCAELRTEFLNRFTAIVVFQPLDLAAQQQVLRLQLNRYLAWLKSRNHHVESSPEAEQFLMLRGFSSRWGARSLRRAIRFHIGEAVVESLLHGGSGSGRLEVDQQQLILRSRPA